jgi:plasmid stabilization system protein ParE
LELIYHRRIAHDLRSALTYYESEGGPGLADRFYDDVESALENILQRPTGHHFSDGGFRRVQLSSFPYNILYEIDGSLIWIAVLRHDRRHPSFGLRRKKKAESDN